MYPIVCPLSSTCTNKCTAPRGVRPGGGMTTHEWASLVKSGAYRKGPSRLIWAGLISGSRLRGVITINDGGC